MSCFDALGPPLRARCQEVSMHECCELSVHKLMKTHHRNIIVAIIVIIIIAIIILPQPART